MCCRECACKPLHFVLYLIVPISGTNFPTIFDAYISYLLYRLILRILSWYVISFFWTDLLFLLKVWLQISSVAEIVVWNGVLELNSVLRLDSVCTDFFMDPNFPFFYVSNDMPFLLCINQVITWLVEHLFEGLLLT